MSVTLRGRVTRFSGQMQCTLSRVDNDTNGVAWFPANDYDPLRRMGARRFRPAASLSAARPDERRQVIDLGVGLTLNSGAPYTACSARTSTTTAAAGPGLPASPATRSKATATRASTCAPRAR
jgi:hypothetical protein